MIISPVAYRYARSLLDLSVEKDQLEAVQEDMALVARTCAESRELQLLLKSPVVKADKKEKILNEVFAGRVGRVTSLFMGILVRKGRESLLPEVAAAFGELYRNRMGILECSITSAAALNETARAHVKAFAETEHPGKSIRISERVDPALIGGLVIRIGDEQYDGSVIRRLADLRRKFSENPYVPEI
ncbi:MAG: ATP synthase F1 subunit delta [Flavobacteriales bacterium]|nr:ATP synthase F1 subunit delta [Flavobacteriales bacterium]MCB9167108.1 ATP synthase F1 subunit delta [Flavobacteriales bacterium]